MSGIEVVALIAGIVSAFGGATELYQAWRERRKERKEQKENQRLQQLVKSSGTQIQQRYDKDFRRLGKFSLAATTVISLLQDNHAYNNFGFVKYPTHDAIHFLSSSVRRKTVSALTEQFQRLSRAAPIQRRIPETPPSERPSAQPTFAEDEANPSNTSKRATPSSTKAGVQHQSNANKSGIILQTVVGTGLKPKGITKVRTRPRANSETGKRPQGTVNPIKRPRVNSNPVVKPRASPLHTPKPLIEAVVVPHCDASRPESPIASRKRRKLPRASPLAPSPSDLTDTPPPLHLSGSRAPTVQPVTNSAMASPSNSKPRRSRTVKDSRSSERPPFPWLFDDDDAPLAPNKIDTSITDAHASQNIKVPRSVKSANGTNAVQIDKPDNMAKPPHSKATQAVAMPADSAPFLHWPGSVTEDRMQARPVQDFRASRETPVPRPLGHGHSAFAPIALNSVPTQIKVPQNVKARKVSRSAQVIKAPHTSTPNDVPKSLHSKATVETVLPVLRTSSSPSNSLLSSTGSDVQVQKPNNKSNWYRLLLYAYVAVFVAWLIKIVKSTYL